MKALVIYDSFFTNTKQIAEAVAAELRCDAIKVSNVQKSNLISVDYLVVGSPIRGWRPTENVMNFLESLPAGSLKGVKVTSFDTRVKLFIHGDAKNKILDLLKASGGTNSVEPEAFYVKGSEGPLFDGELARSVKWAKKIKDEVK